MAFICGALPFAGSRKGFRRRKCAFSIVQLNGTNSAAAAAAAAAFLAVSIQSAQPAQAALFHFRGERPTNIGLRSERYLDGCPPTPNCISSMANVYDNHYVPAWTYAAGKGTQKKTKDAIADVVDVLENYKGATIIEQRPTKSELGKGHYIYAEFESPLMGFVDDVEFFFQPDGKTVEYRSASRLGEGDFNANRKRIKAIRVALQEKDACWASEGY